MAITRLTRARIAVCSWFKIPCTVSPSPHLMRLLFLINAKTELIMETQVELAARLNAVADQLTKALAEILAAVAAQPNASPELVAAADRLATIAKALDDINPDAA